MVTSLNFIKLVHDNIMRLIKCWTALFSIIDHSKVACHTFGKFVWIKYPFFKALTFT